MAKHVIHISEADATGDFRAVMSHVAEGAEVIIERDAAPVAVVRAPESPRGRTLSESIALAEAHARESGVEAAMDPEFAADLEDIIDSRKPRDTSAWD